MVTFRDTYPAHARSGQRETLGGHSRGEGVAAVTASHDLQRLRSNLCVSGRVPANPVIPTLIDGIVNVATSRFEQWCQAERSAKPATMFSVRGGGGGGCCDGGGGGGCNGAWSRLWHGRGGGGRQVGRGISYIFVCRTQKHALSSICPRFAPCQCGACVIPYKCSILLNIHISAAVAMEEGVAHCYERRRSSSAQINQRVVS